MGSGWFVDHLQSLVCISVWDSFSCIWDRWGWCQFILDRLVIFFPVNLYGSFEGFQAVIVEGTVSRRPFIKVLSVSYLGFWVCLPWLFGYAIFDSRKLGFGSCLWLVKVRMLKWRYSVFQLWYRLYTDFNLGSYVYGVGIWGWSDQGSDKILGDYGMFLRIGNFY